MRAGLGRMRRRFAHTLRDRNHLVAEGSEALNSRKGLCHLRLFVQVFADHVEYHAAPEQESFGFIVEIAQ